MSEEPKKSDLELTQELFELLCGRIPEGCKIPRGHRPKLTPDQAWTVIWHLGNQYWQVTDHVERCNVCGDLYESESEGDCLDFGRAPYCFCDNCMRTEIYAKKAKRDPDNRRESK